MNISLNISGPSKTFTSCSFPILALLDTLREEVKQLGLEAVRERELQKMASEDPSKHVNRAEYRSRFRRE